MAKASSKPSLTWPKALGSAIFKRLYLFEHQYQREIFLLLAVGISAFFYTALISYHPDDPSWLSAVYPTRAAVNQAGLVGAGLASAAIFALGMLAWALPLPLLLSAVTLLWRKERGLSWLRVLGWSLLFATLCAGVNARYPQISIKGYLLPTGGVVGQLAYDTMTKALGKVGSVIALGTLAAAGALAIYQGGILAPLGQFLIKKLVPMRHRLTAWWPWRQGPSTQAAIIQPTPASTSLRPEPLAFAANLSGSEPSAAAYFEQPEELAIDASTEETRGAASPVTGPWHRSMATYTPPPMSVFRGNDPSESGAMSPKELEQTASLLTKTFEDFGVQGHVVGFQPGPVVTVFEFQPEAGIKQSKVVGLIDDLALALKVDSIFIHPVRGKRALGVQVPNPKRDAVFFGDIVQNSAFCDADSPLTFGMGKTISGQPMCADLASMPHLLVAGATGSGKSVAINALLASIIMKAAPEDVRMILVDPKMLELSIYEGIPHLLMPVITEPQKASLALQWAAEEMERRYKLMQHAAVRHISGFNALWSKADESRKQQLRDLAQDENIDKLPYILIVIDELADLMMTAPKDVESTIQRLAQKARASGIHMVLATQRPSVDIITGVIKANLPCRIAFQVVSKHDSRTILDLIGAEKLLGKGDMLFQRPGTGRLERLQGALITDEEVLALVAAVKASSQAQYDASIMDWIDHEMARQKDASPQEAPCSMDDDPKWQEALNIARTHGIVSASFLQRHLKIGYNRAARIVEFMEAQGLVAKADGSKPRKWLGPQTASKAPV